MTYQVSVWRAVRLWKCHCVHIQHSVVGSCALETSLGCQRVVSELVHFILPWAQIVFYLIWNTRLGLLAQPLFGSSLDSKQSWKMLVWLCGGCRNRCTDNRVQEVMTENKEGRQVGIWKNSSSEDRTGWASHRTIKPHHLIKLSNPKNISGDAESSWTVRANSVMAQAEETSAFPSVWAQATDNALCSQWQPWANKTRLICVVLCLLRKA